MTPGPETKAEGGGWIVVPAPLRVPRCDCDMPMEPYGDGPLRGVVLFVCRSCGSEHVDDR